MLTKENGFELPFHWTLPEASKYTFTFIALFVFLLVIYSNSFQGDWHFDDFANIVDNSTIKIKSISWHEVNNLIKSIPSHRPLSYLSFAMNFAIGGTNVFGYHVVNFIIHYLSSIFLFLFIYNTLTLSIIREQYKYTAYPVALLATVLWAIHPVFVSSVTYIVQRMASMSGMFYILSMYFYLKARTTQKTSAAIILFICCALSGLSAILSKQNAAILPVSLLLFDLFLIQGVTKENVIRCCKVVIFPVLILLLLGLFFMGGFSHIFDGYAIRDFTMYERLLTEPRIIIFYISLFFYPINSRLTLLYDIDISHSLSQPWTTLPSILLILFIIVAAIYLCRKRPLLSFCILFFFLNHLIEGSVIPLELIFEHRNYIPAMLIFVPVAQFFVYVIDYFSYKKLLQFTVSIGIIIIIAGMGDVTFRRNAIFSDEFLLWSDNIEKYPKLSRPYANLGTAYMNYLQKEEGFKNFEKALALNNFANTHVRARHEHNMGHYHYLEGQYDEALSYFEKSNKIIPAYRPNVIYMAKIHMLKGEYDRAQQLIFSSINKFSEHIDLLEILSLIHIKKKDYQKAEYYAQKVLKKDLSRPFPLSVLAETSRIKGNLRSAIALWELFQSTSHQDAYGNLALIELYNRTNNKEKLRKEIDRLYDVKGNVSIASYLKRLAQKKNLAVYFPEIDEIKMVLNENLPQVE